MFPTKFRALTSDESEESDDSEDVPTVTKEALEQKAISQYQEALALEKAGNWMHSEKILKGLLLSDILTQVQGRVGGTAQSSMAHLKYCVTMNIGHCLVKQNKLEEGLEFYIKATKLDNTDLNLWYRIGLVAMKVPDLNLAASAFEEGLQCSPNHWPSIDNLITVSYALGNYLSCLYFISKGLQMDTGYIKGYAFKEKVFHDSPSLVTDFPLYYPECILPKTPLDISLESELVNEFFIEAETLEKKEKDKWKPPVPKPVIPLQSEQPIKVTSWLQLAKCLLYLFQLAEEQLPDQSLFRPVIFNNECGRESPVEVNDGGSDDEMGDECLGKLNQDGDEDDQGGKGRAFILERWMSSQKRRSARVRSTVRREEPSLARSLAQLIPHNLLPRDEKKETDGVQWSEDSLHTMDLYHRLFENKDSNEEVKVGQRVLTSEERNRIIEEEGYFFSESEKKDIEAFVQSSEDKKENIIDLLKNLTFQLAKKWNIHWPEPLTKYYIKAFLILIDHNPPAMRCGNEPTTHDEDIAVLHFGELLLDQWLMKGKLRGLPSPLGETVLGGEFPSLFLGQLNTCASNTDDTVLIIRIFWLEALLFLHNGETEAAVMALQKIIYDEKCEKIEVKFSNLVHNSVVNCSIASELLKALRRNKNLAEVWDLYTNGCYEDVIDILSDSLNGETDNSTDAAEIIISRPMQFALILDSYWHLANYKECLRWSEFWLVESLSHYRNSSDDERPHFATMIVNTLQGIISCVDTVGCILFDCLAPEKRIRLIQTLSGIICHQMEAPDSSSEMPIESVAPWILLHYIIKYDEEMKRKKSGKKSTELDEEDEISPSLKMLFQGHEYLGRRSWCCFNEGALLYHTLNTVYPIMRKMNSESETLTAINQQVDQIFFCLYGQQKEKRKGRHITDHNVMGLAMTWNRAQQVFIFTKPRSLPSYDSSGRCCISADTEFLYTKLIKLVPDDCNPARLLDEMTKFIEGHINDVPRNTCSLPSDVEDIYYLLAHFYFRSKSWSKALKYYLLDVCANPNRVDSWACLALARGSQIETRLNSCDTIKSECDLLNNASMVCRCYERSLQLDPSQSTLWIERGTFSYTVHSFCSNLLKKEQNLSLEEFSTLEKHKETMINAAYECFKNANKLWYSCGGKDIQDERWLHHYMLGKIAEKREEDSAIYVEHYTKASELLHEIGATYPSHISYSAPQPLAVEALELYYRVHACILKALEDSEDKLLPGHIIRAFKEAVLKFEKSPLVTQVTDFVRYDKAKKVGPHRKVFSSDEEGVSVCTDVKEVMHDLLVKVENGYSSNSGAKRKHSDTNLNTDSDEPVIKAIKYEDNTKTSIDENAEKMETHREQLEMYDVKLESSSVKPAPIVKRNSSSSSGNKKTSDSSSDSDSSTDSSSSSSSSTSSSDSDSSSSDSGQDSDDTDDETSEKKQKPPAQEEPTDFKKEQALLITKCLQAMELCTKRFPEHYKSLYHLAHFYCKSKQHKDNAKVHKLLLGPGGLFHDRKSNNFFNGIWRIPNSEIDRPGSFAAHMGRCVHLLLDFLRETKDHKMLLDLALQLKCIPEADKKYLRDNEREELCHEALTLCAQSLRKKFQECSSEMELKKFIMEVYSTYRRVGKNNFKEPMFGNVLSDIYCKLSNLKGDTGLMVEAAVKYCQQEIAAQRQAAAVTPIVTSQSLSATSAITITTIASTTPSVTSLPSQLTITPQQQSPLAPKLTSPHIVTPPPEVIMSSINTARRGSRGGVSGRKQRGRPPLGGSNPRMPSPRSFTDMMQRHNFSSFPDPRIATQMALMYQNEFLRQSKLSTKDLMQILKTSTAVPLTQSQDPIGGKPAGKTLSHMSADISKSGNVPLIKDRPNLSITPVKPSQNQSPTKSSSTPISVSVQKLMGKSQTKHQAIDAANKKLPISVTPVTQSIAPSRSSLLVGQSSVVGVSKQMGLSPGSLAPTAEVAQRKLPQPVVAHPFSVLQKTVSTPPQAHPYPEQKSGPQIHNLPQKQDRSLLQKTGEPSLQHKLLSKKMMASGSGKTKSRLPTAPPDIEREAARLHKNLQPSSSTIADITRSISEGTFSGTSTGDMTICKLPVKQQMVAHSSIITSVKTPSPRVHKRKEPMEALSITPAQNVAARNLPRQPPSSDKFDIFNTVRNLDSSVAETIRNFGSSITITPTSVKSSKPPPDLSVQPVNKSKDTKIDPCEVIVLDD